ncbi:hypothetical protein DENSPDRAFT_244333 [Dentipellis sp. KUC8613]|nr:hypothetical protein DENSPDRAFT_244333 [Dentipellis sp. KUC8613]
MQPQAGPSSPSATSSAPNPAPLAPIPPLYLLPPAPPQPTPLLASTQDLISRFHLLPAYDKFVRPLVTPAPVTPSTPNPSTPAPYSATFPSLDKGKGKEREQGTPAPDGDDEDGRDGKKKKNSYKHLIKGIPGRHSMKKDDFLTTTIQAPPKQLAYIKPFDLKTQQDAFSVSLEGLKGWNIHALVLESTQAREDRKKRKELKRLAKAQATGAAPLPPQPARSSTPVAAAPTPPARTSTPVHSAPTPAQTQAPGPRGTKRELDETGPGPGSGGVNGYPPPTNGVGAARAGVPGARPRPVKKQRTNLQGQARDVHHPHMPVQQPTPQGI